MSGDTHLLALAVDRRTHGTFARPRKPSSEVSYAEADLPTKERALAKLHEPDTAFQRYRDPDSRIDFLNTL